MSAKLFVCRDYTCNLNTDTILLRTISTQYNLAFAKTIPVRLFYLRTMFSMYKHHTSTLIINSSYLHYKLKQTDITEWHPVCFSANNSKFLGFVNIMCGTTTYIRRSTCSFFSSGCWPHYNTNLQISLSVFKIFKINSDVCAKSDLYGIQTKLSNE